MTAPHEEFRLNPAARRKLVDAVRKWAENHPRKTVPALQIIGGRRFSPVEIIQELDQETSAGKLILRVLENGARHHSVEDIVKRFERPVTGQSEVAVL